MTTKWSPSDDELDGLARTLAPELANDDAEQLRTTLLANAANAKQLSRHSRIPVFVAIGATVAAAAAVLLWIAVRPTERATPRADVVAIGAATFALEQNWPIYSVRLDQGRIAIDVSTVDETQRFVAKTSDAEISVRSSKLTVDVDQRRVTSVEVTEGNVELRYSGSTILLAAGQSWKPAVRTAEVIVEPPASSPVADESTPKSPEPAKPVRVERHAPARVVPRSKSAASKAVPSAPSPVAPGELAFRAGVASLRSGDALAAEKSFAAACAAARDDALGEDACFWVGAAAKRAGRSTAARDALTRFLQQFPKSARAGEASALLGWLLYDGGDLDGAERRFQTAASDRVPSVAGSAARGLEAIKRKRAKP